MYQIKHFFFHFYHLFEKSLVSELFNLQCFINLVGRQIEMSYSAYTATMKYAYFFISEIWIVEIYANIVESCTEVE